MEDRLLNEWKVISKSTDGEFSVVYKVVRDDGFVCAIKEMNLPRPQEDMEVLIRAGKVSSYDEATNYFAKSIQDELDLMKKFNGNPNIINFYEFTQVTAPDGTSAKYYIRMEYVEDIKSHFKNHGVSQLDVVKLGIDICSALELFAHNSMTHNDVKPGNIFIDNNGKYKLGDFGIACSVGSSDLVTFGTLNYVSPEVIKKEQTSLSTDLYSLGLVMYKLLCGDLPFVGGATTESKAIEKRLSGEMIPAIEGVNRNLMDIILKACSYNPNNRYVTPTEMKNQLLQLNGISDRKQAISFASSVIESTISIYDKDLLNSQSIDVSVAAKKERILNKIPKHILIRRGVFAVVIFITLIGFLQVYRLNRSCGVGEINKAGKCVSGYYYCDDGYVLKNDKCQKTIESTDAKVSYTCKDGYTLNGDICINNDIREPKPTLRCVVDGYTLNTKTSKCEMVVSGDASAQLNCSGNECLVDSMKNYSCSDSSYKLSGTKCTKTTTTTKAATPVYSCASGGELSGTICNYTTDATSTGTGWWGWGGTPTCSQGQYSYYDQKCHYSENASVSYTCSSGKYDGRTSCVITNNLEVAANVSYSCNKGYTLVLDSNMCAKTSNVTKYVCPDNAVLKGKKCYTTITMEPTSLFECDEGFILNGTACVKNEEVKAVKKYTCSKVYTLNGGKCEKYSITSAKAHYNE